MRVRTQVRDAILATVAPDHGRAEVEAIEWAALEDTADAMLARPLAHYDEYSRTVDVLGATP